MYHSSFAMEIYYSVSICTMEQSNTAEEKRLTCQQKQNKPTVFQIINLAAIKDKPR